MMERSSHYTILRKVSSANGSTSPEGSDPATRPASPCTSGQWSTPDSPGAPVPVAGRYIFSPMGRQSANHVLLSSMTAATPPVIGSGAIASGNVLRVDVDGIGTGVQGLNVFFVVEKSS